MAIQQRGKNSWRIIIYSGSSADGKRNVYTKTVHGTRENAKQVEKLFDAEVAKKRNSGMRSAGMSLKEFFAYWLTNYAQSHLADKTINLYKSEFYRINIALGHKPLDKIEPKHILKFYQNLQICPRMDGKEGGLSNTTIQKYHVLLRLLFKRAMRWQFIFNNPVDCVDPPKYKYENKKIILNYEQAGNFFALLENEELKYRVACLLGVALGLRRGEILGLQWKHVDFIKSTIYIEQACQYLPKNGVFIKPPKTESAIRLISVPLSLMNLLKEYKEKKTAEQQLLANRWIGGQEIKDNFLFTTWNGRVAHPDSLNTWLARFVARYDLPKITPHSFRHMAATYLITAGVDLRTVAGKLGHANSVTTQLVYSHLMKTAEHETADIMENILQKNISKRDSSKKI